MCCLQEQHYYTYVDKFVQNTLSISSRPLSQPTKQITFSRTHLQTDISPSCLHILLSQPRGNNVSYMFSCQSLVDFHQKNTPSWQRTDSLVYVTLQGGAKNQCNYMCALVHTVFLTLYIDVRLKHIRLKSTLMLLKLSSHCAEWQLHSRGITCAFMAFYLNFSLRTDTINYSGWTQQATN